MFRRKRKLAVTLTVKKVPVEVEYEHFNLRRRATVEVAPCLNVERTMRRAENLIRRMVGFGNGPDSLKIVHTSMVVSS